jgi:hypothetical protein
MTQSKKYDYHLEQDGASWTVDIVRRVTSRTSVVTKSQGGFTTEAEAQAWGQNEVKEFLNRHNLNEQQKRRARKIEDEKKILIKPKPEEKAEDQED